VAAALALLGARWSSAIAGDGDGALQRLVLASMAGWLTLHLLLTALELCGIRWTLPAILATAAVLAVAARRLPAPAPLPGMAARRRRLPSDYGWGDGLALAALLVYTACALSLWITIPDFVYHWGIKGERYFLAGGVDYAFLASPANWVLHPDYPNLLPELFAVSALVARRWSEPAMMLWSPICLALLLAAAREALRRAGVSRFMGQAALATLAMALAAYGIGAPSAGGADWLIVLALGAALPPLLAPPDARGAAQVGLIAAVAAAAKIEGVALAGALLGVYAVRLLAAARASGPAPPRAAALRTVLALGLPSAAVVLPWLALVRHYHLFLPFNAGPLVPARLPQVLAQLGETLPAPPWHGFAYALALVPLLGLDRRLRAVVAVVCLQALFYLYVFLSVRIDPLVLIQASLSRLVMHLLPAVLVGIAIALERGQPPQALPGGSPADG
jgi:hypothetical protein